MAPQKKRWRNRSVEVTGSTQTRQLHIEQLEARLVLSSSSLTTYDQVSPQWFGQAEESPIGALGDVGANDPETTSESTSTDRWIIRLTPEAIAQSTSISDVMALFDDDNAPVQVTRGLGLPGQLLVATPTTHRTEAQAWLSTSELLAYFERDTTLTAQATPSDPSYQSDLLVGLNNEGLEGGVPGADIDAALAWDITTGSPEIVAAVLDTGIDLNHQDLANNIWINPGEIPAGIVDTDADMVITFADLQLDGANASEVVDSNLDNVIDASDLLLDPNWVDSVDNDGNGFVDDLFGWDFRNEDNSPMDDHGHGTHVAGTLGAVGNNGIDVTGVAWDTSIMPLKFLGENNVGFTSDAIEAINYATMMRTRSVDPVNLRVMNNSWGGNTFNFALQQAIAASDAADIFFVAAAGNGNIFGGVDNDNLPFYPANYGFDSIISVAASDRIDGIARFSNFGETTVDIAAPGVGILSTEIGDVTGVRSGTSMAAPHVAGVAALLYSQNEGATSAEVKAAILSGAESLPVFQDKVVSDGRLSALGALQTDTFAPQPTLNSALDITLTGTTPQTITIEYRDTTGVDVSTLDDLDVIVTRLDGSGVTFTATFASVDVGSNGPVRVAQYEMQPPGGTWDTLDNGDYEIALVSGQVSDTEGNLSAGTVIGSFAVDLSNPGEFFVDAFADTVDANPGDGNAVDASGATTLRAAIQESNAQVGDNTIFLASGTFSLSLGGASEDLAATGDLDITDTVGTLTIVGAGADQTIIDAASLDRVFDLRPGVTVVLSGVTISGGMVTGDGGALLVDGASLTLSDSAVVSSQASGLGGGIAVAVGGDVEISRTTLSGNQAGTDGGAIASVSTLLLTNTTVSTNTATGDGGGLHMSAGSATVVSSTFTLNDAQTGGGIRHAGGVASLHNTIVAANTAATDPDVAGAFTSLNNNLIGDGGSATGFGVGTGDLVGSNGSEIDPLLSPLQDNTGTTLTHVPLPGSPAIDAGDDIGAPATDQRLVARPQDGNDDSTTQVDIGAVERFYGTISGVHFHDLDGNSVQDGGEPPLEGWTIYVDVNDNGQFDAGEPSAVTASDGSYTIGGVVPGLTYSVRLILQDGWEQTSPDVSATALLVTNTNDSGAGSLRQAIIDANNNPGLDVIEFAIGGAGPHTIQPLTQLPTISDPLTIDGYSQSGASPNTNLIDQASNAVLMIELDGTNAGANADGLFIDAGGSKIRGLVINRFEGQAIDIRVGAGNVLEGNFLGTDISGSSHPGGTQQGLSIQSDNNLLGGPSPDARNIISGSSLANISVGGNNNRIQGNFIGTDLTGTQAVTSLGFGVHIASGTLNFVGTDGNGINDQQERNLISGNAAGVFVSANGNTIAGNFIGTDLTGSTIIGTGNQSRGVRILGDNNRIGTDGDGVSDNVEGNLISGGFGGSGTPNATHAVDLDGDNNTLAGNRIGTDVTGLVALGNLGAGVLLNGTGNRIGTDADGTSDTEERNIVSGNGREGIRMTSGGNNIVAGNFIGVDATGTGAMGNGASGIFTGVVVSGSGNRIGSDVDGTRDNVEANIIAYNTQQGIRLDGTGTGNLFRLNQIFASDTNGGIPIDLGDNGVTNNDLNDVDTGPNNLQNYPVFSSARTDGVDTQIVGTINSAADTTFAIDFYANSSANAAGHGEAERFLASRDVTTDSSGNASFDLLLPAGTVLGEFISATATDPGGNTSEFAAAIAVAGPINLVVNSTSDSLDVTPGDGIVEDNAGNATLRAAVMEANALPGDDTIQLSAGTYGLTIAGTGEDATLTGDLDVTSVITIVGAGPGVTTIDANTLDRLFDVRAGGTLTLQNLTLTDGSVADGGAIKVGNGQTLVLNTVEVVGNSSVGGPGGAISGFRSTIDISNSTFENNSSDQFGGAISLDGGELIISGSVFRTNQAPYGAALDIDDSTSPVVTITGSTFDGNINTDAGQRTILVFNPSGPVTLSDSSIINSTGGGISVGGASGALTITRSIISGNIGGGGIEANRPATIIDSTISGNSGGFGGGIRTQNHLATISGSTISGNTATTYGGGIMASGPLIITNSTFSGNQSNGPGGAIKINSDDVTLTNVTITENTATTGGGISTGSGAFTLVNTIVAGNTGTASDADVVGPFTSGGSNLIGDIGSATGLTDGVNGDIVGDSAGSGVVNAMLGPLTDNGGRTETHLPLTGSPAIDAGTSNGAPADDQRRNPRPLDGDDDGLAQFDIGAVEVFDGFIVNTTSDTPDVNLGDGVASDVSGNTSLRAAIMEANALGGTHKILLSAETYALSIAGASEDLAATGDLDITANIEFIGAGASSTTIDAAGLDRVFEVLNSAIVDFSGLTVTGGSADDGGGLLIHSGTVTIVDSTFSMNNATSRGGGISISGGLTSLTRVDIRNNTSTNIGGGLHNDFSAQTTIVESTIDNNMALSGGGISVNSGTVEVTASTISNNSTTSTGGGVFLNGATTLTLDNSTVSGNSSTQGGGFSVQGTLIATSSTITANSATGAGGGIERLDVGASVSLQNTIVAANTGSSGADLAGLNFTSLGNNLIGDIGTATGLSDGVNGDLVGDSAGSGVIDPLLGPLADNGGTTLTHTPLAGSPAIDAGGSAGSLVTDQRGAPRVLDGNGDQAATIDIGAVEFVAGFLVNSTLDTVDANPGDGVAQDGAGNTSLRAAIMEANALGGSHSIILASGTYTLTILGVGEDLAATGDLDVTAEITIVGNGADQTTIDAAQIDRVFDVRSGGSLTLSSVTVTGGATVTEGGGVRNLGTLQLLASSVRDNLASASAGFLTDASAEFLINTSDAGMEYNPDVATNDAGQTVVTWTSFENDAPDQRSIRAQRYDATGQSVGSEIIVSPATGTKEDQRVAIDDSGRFAVVWYGIDAEGDGDGAGILLQRYDAGGTPLGAPTQVNTTSVGDQTRPTISMAADGKFVVVWVDRDGGASATYDVFARRYDSNGNPLGSEFLINSTTTNMQVSPDVAMADDGSFYVSWQSHSGLTTSDPIDAIYVSRFDASGSLLGGINAEITVNTSPVETLAGLPYQAFSNVAATDDGFLVIWESAPAGGNGFDVLGQRFDLMGNPVGGEIVVVSTTAQKNTVPHLTALDDGGFLLSWRIWVTDDEQDVFARRLDSAGQPTGPEFLVNETTALAQSRIRMAASSADKIWSTWFGNGPGDPDGIFARTFSAPVTPVGGGVANFGDVTIDASTISTNNADAGGGLWNDGTATITNSTFSGNAATTQAGAIYNSATAVANITSTTVTDNSVSGLTAATFLEPDGDEFRVNATVNSSQQQAHLAMNEDGQYVVAWESGHTGQANEIFGRIYSADSGTLGPVFQISPGSAENRLFPNVSINDSGDFVVAYGGGNGGNLFDVFARRFASDGTPLTSAFSVNTSVTGQQRMPWSALADDGNLLVAWQDEDSSADGSDSAARARWYDVVDSTIAGPLTVNTTTAGRQERLTAAMNASGESIVVWEDRDGQDGSLSGIYAQLYNVDGSPRGSEFRVNNATNDNQTVPSVEMNADQVVISWGTRHVDGNSDVFARRFDLSGNPLSDEFQVNQNSIGDHGTSDVGMNRRGQFVVTWSEAVSDVIYARAFDADGNPLGDEFIVPTTAEVGQFFSRVDLDADGNAVVVWHGNGDTDAVGIYARRFQTPLEFANGIYNADGGTVNLQNTLVAANAVGNNAPDIVGGFTSLAGNLIGEVGNATGLTDGVNGDQVGTAMSPIDPLLGPLQDNGGPTQTHVPQSGSPAIDAGNNSTTSAVDQRGVPRILDGDGDQTATADVGAVEVLDGFLVNTTLDTVDINPGDGLAIDANGNTSLRAAVMEANALGGAQTIALPPGTYGLSIAGIQEDLAATGDLDITANITLVGSGADVTIVDAAELDRVVDVLAGGSLSVSFISLQGGNSNGAPGGGIRNSGMLNVDSAVVDGNIAERAAGGGIYNSTGAVATVTRSTLSNNQSFGPNTLFAARQEYDPASGGTYGVSPGDIDGDGDIDFIAPNYDDASITVFRNDGQGVFTPTVIPGLGNRPSGARLHSDVTGDGNPDIVVTHGSGGGGSGDIRVLSGDGNGNFSVEPVPLASFGTEFNDFELVDVNGDGVEDIVAANGFSASQGLLLLLINPGSAPTVTSNNVDTNSSSVALGFLNGDALLDAVVGNQAGESVTVLFGQQSGGPETFQFSVSETIPEADDAGFVLLEDFNEDGNLDLVVSRSTTQTISLRLGNGDGSFQAATLIPIETASPSILSDIVAGDIDRDGALDLIVSAFDDGAIHILLGLGNGTFRSPQRFEVGDDAFKNDLADFDGDGWLDLVVANRDVGAVNLLFNTAQFALNGGGIANLGTLTVDSSTVSGNSADSGGGIYNNGAAMVRSSTLSGNSATAEGGGFFSTATATASIANSTIADNAAAGVGAFRQLQPIGNEFKVNDGTTGTQDFADVSTNASGHSIIAWDGGESGTEDQDVYAQRFLPNGSLSGENFRVNNASANRRHRPAVSVAPDGSHIIAFAGTGIDNDGVGIRAWHYSDFSGSTTSTFRVNETQAGNQTSVQLAAADNGYVVIHDSPGAPGDVYARQYDLDAIALTGEVRANLDSSGNQLRQDVGLWSDGGFVVVWSEQSAIEARVFDSSLNALTGDVQLKASTGPPLFDTAIYTLDSGFVAVWRESGASIRGRQFDRLGTPIGDEFVVFQSTDTVWMSPTIAPLPNGGFAIAWSAQADGASDQDVYVRQYNAQAKPVTAAEIISQTTAGDQKDGDIAVAADGSGFIVWDGNGPGDDQGIFARRVGPVGYYGGGIFVSAGGTLELNSTIVAGNQSDDDGSDVVGAFNSEGNNLIGDVGDATGLADGVNGDQVGDDLSPIDPLLGPLQDNGGPTQTHVPQSGSPAIDAGNSTGVPATDQRGTTRVLDGEPDGVATIDVGAVEVDLGGTTFVVNTTTDSVDATPGDGVAQDAGGLTSLRAAIQEANASAGFDTITLGPGTYTLTLSGASENAAATGDLDITDHVSIVGAGADVTIIDASGLGDRVFEVLADQFAGFSGITITGGTRSGLGLNAAGGGILNRGTVRIEAATIDGNMSNSDGGGLRNLAAATVTIIDSTFSNNVARNGGGLHNEGTATATSSTFSGNSIIAGSNRRGGAVFQQSGSLTVEASTITNNTADDEAGGIYVNSGTATLLNTVVAGNSSTSTADVDVSGSFVSLGNNLIGDIGSATGLVDGVNDDQVGDSAGSGAIDPLLGALQDNGGTTLTHAPMAGSPLIDAGSNTQARPKDQRDLRRILDGDDNLTAVVDIGSVEFFGGFIVNTTADTVDANPGDGQALDASGNTSLRAAIMEANQQVGITSILLDGLTYTLNLTGTESNNATVGDLDLFSATTSVTIFGAGTGQTTIDAQGIDRLFDVASGATLSLLDLTLTGGSATASGEEDGGAIYNDGGTVSLTRVAASGNTADESGAAIYQASGALTLTASTLSGNIANSASSGGGGLFTYSGTVDLIRTTLANNMAYNGGGIYSYGGMVTIDSSTISGNMATSLGGGIVNVANLTIRHSTITNNSGDGAGGGVASYGADISVTHSIIAGNSSTSGGRDIQGGFSSQGYNLIGIDDGAVFAATGDQVGSSGTPLDPLLGVLANNGGPTQTHSLLDGSPAIDVGDGAIVSPPVTDQRGESRIENSTIDIGAYEVSAGGALAALGGADDGQIALAATSTDDGPIAASQATAFGVPGVDVWNVTVRTGDAFSNIDFGARALPGEIRGQKFHDLNGDGFKDPFEPGLAGWEIYLDENNNQQHDDGEQLVVTDTNGAYEFLNLASERTYSIAEVPQLGWVQTFPTANQSQTVFLNAGESRTGVDFGNVEEGIGGSGNGDLAGQIFNDINADGDQDAGELGISGVTVYLDFNDNGQLDGGEPTDVTNQDGDYQFDNVVAGEYAVRVVVPVNGTQTSPSGVDNRPLTSSLETQTQPNSIASGDFDRDGNQDLAVVNAGQTTLSVFFGDGQGGFQAPTIVNVGAAPISIQAVQFDDDNSDDQIDDGDYVDLIVGYAGTNFVSVLVNNQSGGFVRSDAIAPYAPWFTAPGDFDQDGDVDIVTVHVNQSIVSFLERIPAGFVSPAPTIANGQDPASLITVQLTDDNSDFVVDDTDRLDLAWVDLFPGANTVSALFNDGGLSFTRITKNVGGRPFAVVAGDFNGDGFQDLAATIPETNQVALLVNNQSGNFALPSFTEAGLGPTALTAEDLDGDGDIDLAVTNASDEGFTLLRNDGSGSFTAEVSGSAAVPNPLAVSIVAAQLDDDPILDLAIANGLGSESVLFLANRVIDRAQRETILNGSTTSGVNFGIQLLATGEPADFDGDGDVDGADFLSWQRGFGIQAPNATKADGDADNDGDVDSDDLGQWLADYGTGALQSLAAGEAAFSTAENIAAASAVRSTSPTELIAIDAAVLLAIDSALPDSLIEESTLERSAYRESVRDRVLRNDYRVPARNSTDDETLESTVGVSEENLGWESRDSLFDELELEAMVATSLEQRKR